jgi:hypothetical protein
MEHGRRTREIAERLQESLLEDPKRYSGVRVYYDHGDSTKTEVCQPTSYMGRRYGADATLSGIDIALVKNGTVFLAVEVEESEVRPKTVLGDAFGVILADRIRIHNRPYPLDDAVLIVAIATSGRGKRAAKYFRLERHLRKYVRVLRRSSLRTGVKKVRLVAAPPSDMVRRIERLVRLEVGKALSSR